MSRKQTGYTSISFSVNRRMVAASAAVSAERSTIHGVTEVDISEPRRLMREQRQRTGERLSLTAYVITCLARAVAENPQLNAFRRGRRLIVLEDVTVSALVEREIEGEKVPEPVGIRAAHKKTYREIHEEIRAAQRHGSAPLGSLSGMGWVVRLIPGFLLRTFVRLASRSIRMAQRYGVVSVTAVGMFGSGSAGVSGSGSAGGRGALWFIPHGGATVLVTVGGIVERPVVREGRLQAREHLCLTVSFDHAIVDGAPAARFIRRLGEIISSGETLSGAVQADS